MAYHSDKPERPRVEPEIIPPDRPGRNADWRQPPWRGGVFEARGPRRVYVARMGPLGFGLLMLAIAAIVALVIIAVLGAVLIWIPIVAIVFIIGAVLRLLRG